MLFKNLTDGIVDVDASKGIVKFYASKFGVKDSDGDIIHPGSYKKTIAENGPSGANRIKHLFNHDRSKVLSKPKELYEDADGVVMVSQITPTSYGKDVIVLYENKAIDEHSVGIMPIKEQAGSDGNHMYEVKMLEASTVAFGANEWAKTIDYKSDPLTVLSNYTNLLKSFRDGAFRDETFTELETILKRHRDELTKALEAAHKHSEPPPKPPTDDELIKAFASKLNLTI